MAWIEIKGAPPFDGRYEYDEETRPLTTAEWGWVKRLAGYLPVEMNEKAFGDPELITVLAAIVATRSGKATIRDMRQTFDQLAAYPFEEIISFEEDEEVVEEISSPPPPSSNSSAGTSGPGSRSSLETSPPIPRVSGTHGSVTSLSHPERSGS